MGLILSVLGTVLIVAGAAILEPAVGLVVAGVACLGWAYLFIEAK